LGTEAGEWSEFSSCHVERSAGWSAGLQIAASSLFEESLSCPAMVNSQVNATILTGMARSSRRPELGPRFRLASGLHSVPRFYFGLAFLVGLLQPVTIAFVGKVPLSELLLLLVPLHAAIALASKRALPVPLPSPRILALVLFAQLVAFGSYIVSDLWRESLPLDMMRGWLRMILLLPNIAAFALLFGAGKRTFVLMQIGIVLACIFPFMEGPLFDDYWKFCFAYPVTIVVLMATPRFLGFWATVAASLGLGIFHLLMQYRSLGTACLLLAGLLVFARTLPRLFRKYLFISCLLIFVATLPWVFGGFVTGTLGSASRSNVERSAMLQAAWEGFLNSPLVGNGSWFSKSDVWDNFLTLRSTKALAANEELGFDPTDLEGVAIHSQILTALAEGGLFGGAFFVIYIAILLAGLWFLLIDAAWHWLMPIRLSILISSLWGVFMDPFSGTARLSIAIGVALSLVLLAERKALIRRRLRPGSAFSRNSSARALAPPNRTPPRSPRWDELLQDSTQRRVYPLAWDAARPEAPRKFC
jgi:hypothetical protein